MAGMGRLLLWGLSPGLCGIFCSAKCLRVKDLPWMQGFGARGCQRLHRLKTLVSSGVLLGLAYLVLFGLGDFLEIIGREELGPVGPPGGVFQCQVDR